MKLKHALSALAAVILVVCGFTYVAQAAPTAPAPCTDDGVAVTCVLPYPVASTVTATVTATATATTTVTATVTASPSASPTPTVTPTPTPTPTPSPTPTQPPPPSGGFPDASNTGVPAGTVLTTYTGPSTITTPNTVITGKNIGCLTIATTGVIIRNSHLSCANRGPYVLTVDDRTSAATVVTVEDSEVDCKNGPGTAIGEADVTVRRTNIHGCENGFDVNQNVTVEDSYIHDLWNSGGSHTDGIQLAGGHWNGSSYPCCALNVTVRHNTIYGVGFDGSLGTSAMISNPRGDVNVTIADNLLGGGAYTLYCDYQAKGTSYSVTGNHFTKRFSAKYGAYGPSDGCSDESQSGNVDHETGQPIQLN